MAVTYQDLMNKYCEKLSLRLSKEQAGIKLSLQPVCDCGAVKCKTTHARWCSTMEKK